MKKFFIASFIVALIFVSIAFAQTGQTISLKAGFNFVCFNISPEMTPAAFKTANMAVEDIYLYSAAAGGFLSMSDGTLTALSANI